MSACPPLLSIERPERTSCHEFNQAMLDQIRARPEIDTVILAARWVLSVNGTRYKSEDGDPVRLVDLLAGDRDRRDIRALFEAGLLRTVEQLLAMGKRVALVLPVPEVGYEVPSAVFMSAVTGRDVNAVIAPSVDEYRQRVGAIESLFTRLEQDKTVSVVDPARYLCDGRICNVVAEGRPLYRDDDHLSTFGARYVSSSFDTLFRDVAARDVAAARPASKSSPL